LLGEIFNLSNEEGSALLEDTVVLYLLPDKLFHEWIFLWFVVAVPGICNQ
jgi:hypothetical protein